METGHRDRILAEVGAESFYALERGLSPTDLQSLLLEVSRARAGAVTASRVLTRRRDDRLVQPSSVDPRVMVLFDSVAFAAVGGAFTPIELAPVCPFGGHR